ncbi:MAG: ABC transporter ATP-binding protein, partial [Burkholderiales bacterium]|nr:ABC transporter ATP-binding protein [Opitutaceae bacterium]
NLLVEYEGTLLVVSHDRSFLDEVVSSTLVFEGNGQIGDFDGGYTDWKHEMAKRAAAVAAPLLKSGVVKPTGKAAAAAARKLNNKEQRELAELPALIERLETEQTELTTKLGDVSIYRKDPDAASAAKARLDEIEAEHAKAFARWEELEAVNNA